MKDLPKKKRIEELSKKWLNGTLTKEEQEEYDLWYNSYQDKIVEDFSEENFNEIGKRIYLSIEQKESLRNARPQNTNSKIRYRTPAVAASILILMLAGAFVYFQSYWLHQEVELSSQSNIVPGRNRAILNVGNEVILDLDSLHVGDEYETDAMKISINQDGELTYSAKATSGKEDSDKLNIVSTPRGGQFVINLSDGSRVWLNASSTLSFPNNFSGKQRIVELKGEAYFEVATKTEMPFIVRTTQEEVEVLGTHFNVSSYQSDPTSTVSLLEGKVKVSTSSQQSIVLKPGEQSIVKKGLIEVQPFNLNEAIAWKDGEFMFNNENIKNAMTKIARWYDVEVDISAIEKDIEIWGTVSKYKDIEEVLKVIEMTGSVHFKIEGRRIYVMP